MKQFLLFSLLIGLCSLVVITARNSASAAQPASAMTQVKQVQTPQLVAQTPQSKSVTASVVEAQSPTVTKAIMNEHASIDQLIVSCAACHGSDGNSTSPTFPKLAGQNNVYLLKQMRNIQSAARSVPEMTGQLDALSDTQLQAIATYFAKQKPSLNQASDNDLALGEKIYRLGNMATGVPACTGCHSPTGRGNALAGFPALSGQHAAYVVTALKAFRTGAEYADKGRRNDEMQGVMRDIAVRMTDREIEAVANYISGLY